MTSKTLYNFLTAPGLELQLHLDTPLNSYLEGVLYKFYR